MRCKYCSLGGNSLLESESGVVLDASSTTVYPFLLPRLVPWWVPFRFGLRPVFFIEKLTTFSSKRKLWLYVVYDGKLFCIPEFLTVFCKVFLHKIGIRFYEKMNTPFWMKSCSRYWYKNTICTVTVVKNGSSILKFLRVQRLLDHLL